MAITPEAERDEARLAGLEGACRSEGALERLGPRVELGFRDPVADLHVLGRVVTVGGDALGDLGEPLLIPVDFLGQIGSDADVPVVKMDDAGVLACCQAELVGAVGVLEVQCAIDVLDDRLGSNQEISGVALELEQRFAGKRCQFTGRGG